MRTTILLTSIVTAVVLLLGIHALLVPAAKASSSFRQIYYVPLPETDVRASLLALYGSTGSTMHSVVSIVATKDGSLVYYDHWEDGYELDLTNPTETSTEIWGDNDPSNGIPPGYVTDEVNAGDVIALENDVPIPRNPADIYYDGRDKLGASQSVAVTRSSWATNPGTVLAGAVEVYNVDQYGLNFSAPVGQER